eukprot:9475097-Pyramimonas_sp.AAC.1
MVKGADAAGEFFAVETVGGPWGIFVSTQIMRMITPMMGGLFLSTWVYASGTASGRLAPSRV